MSGDIEQLEIPNNARAALNELSEQIETITGNGFGVLHPSDDLSDLVDNLRAMVAVMRDST